MQWKPPYCEVSTKFVIVNKITMDLKNCVQRLSQALLTVTPRVNNT